MNNQLIKKIILKYKKPLLEMLGLENIKIKWKIKNRGDISGESIFSSKGTVEIVIYCNQHIAEKDVVITMFHELCHVLLYPIERYIKPECWEEFSKKEEEIVTYLENFITYIVWEKR